LLICKARLEQTMQLHNKETIAFSGTSGTSNQCWGSGSESGSDFWKRPDPSFHFRKVIKMYKMHCVRLLHNIYMIYTHYWTKCCKIFCLDCVLFLFLDTLCLQKTLIKMVIFSKKINVGYWISLKILVRYQNAQQFFFIFQSDIVWSDRGSVRYRWSQISD
jgi:hypothetical protein